MLEITEIIASGVEALFEYLSAHVLFCLVPAFFIAGGIAVFASAPAVIKYFGPKAKKAVSYSVASVSGTILAVCSCTVLPLFGAIYKRGAGLGPAIAFLYSAPAINILAIVYSARLLGFDLGAGRAISAVVFSIAIGLVMAWLFRREEQKKIDNTFDEFPQEEAGKKPVLILAFFSFMVGILVSAAAGNFTIAAVLIALLIFMLWRWFTKEELKAWLGETWRYVKLITPWLLGGVFIAGVLRFIVPESVITSVVGDNSLISNFIASFLGALMYFATLTEVPIIKSFMELGMDKGPALALLLAGPALSLPNLLVIRKIMGGRKTLVYAGLVVIFATLTGFGFGMLTN